MKKFIVNYKTRVIGRRDDGVMIVTNHPSYSLNNIYKKAIVIDKEYNILNKNDTIYKLENYQMTNEFLLNRNIAVDSVIGFAIGDAFGVPVEFKEREYVKSLDLKDMIISNITKVKGAWSDDTSMIVATMDSIIKSNGIIDYKYIMNNFIELVDNGKFTSLGYAFDVGTTITKALKKYKETKDELNSGCIDIMHNGNGSLMRILPISLYCILNNLSNEETLKIINKASSLTHSHEISKLGCLIYTIYLKEIIRTKNKLKAFESILNYDYSIFSEDNLKAYSRLLNIDFLGIEEDKIKSTGYVVDTLQSVIYSINLSNNYKEAIITSVNLGFDTDTIGALTGAVAGILYGISDIPDNWLVDLVKKDYLVDYSNKFYAIITK